MAIINTGVFATEEEVHELRQIREYLSAPLVHLTMKHAENLDRADEDLKAKIDRLAQEHGLPAPGLIDGEPNHYGMSAKGEFTRWEP